MQDKLIDIERLIASKNPTLLRWLPRFIISYLKRILHQEEINQIIAENQHLEGYDFAKAIVDHFNLQLNCVGLENLPKSGGYIFTCNHPLGGMDALALIDLIYPHRQDMKFIVNDLLMNLKNLQEFFIGVNKHGSTSQSALSQVNELFNSNNAVFIFPAGLVSRREGKHVEDLEWKKTVISRAKKFNKTVIPVYIDGRLSNFFYNFSNIRKKLVIKANIEMLYLAHELFKQKNKSMTVVIGEPIESTTFTKERSDKGWAQWLKSRVYSLSKQV